MIWCEAYHEKIFLTLSDPSAPPMSTKTTCRPSKKRVVAGNLSLEAENWEAIDRKYTLALKNAHVERRKSKKNAEVEKMQKTWKMKNTIKAQSPTLQRGWGGLRATPPSLLLSTSTYPHIYKDKNHIICMQIHYFQPLKKATYAWNMHITQLERYWISS